MDIVLGTVQFGIDYGITNKSGITPFEEVGKILKYGKIQNVEFLDTAPGYGKSEEVLGKHSIDGYKVITKTPHLQNAVIRKEDIAKLEKSFYHSLEVMQQQSVYGLLVHNIQDCYKEGANLLFDYLHSLKSKGLVKKIGFSVYEKSDIEFLLNSQNFDIIQVPLNVVDQRIHKSNLLSELKERNVEIFVRSVFLQGLLLTDLDKLDENFNKLKCTLKRYYNELENNNLSKLEGALMFMHSIPEIDHLIVGVTNKNQLIEICNALQKINNINRNILNYDKFSIEDVDIIDPRRW